MKIYALLTGRGNNTLKDKNIREICGKPVLYYPANAAKKAFGISNWYCSSDDKKILNAASQLGYTPIVRPLELARPDSQHVDAVKHALSEIEKKAEAPDILVVLLANNVTVKKEWINDCIDIMRKDMSISAVVPVYEDKDHHPLRAKKQNVNGELVMYEDNISSPISTNRQDLPQCLFLAHNFWVINVQSLKNNEIGQPPWAFLGKKVIPYFIDESLDIHDELDLILATEWVKKNYID